MDIAICDDTSDCNWSLENYSFKYKSKMRTYIIVIFFNQFFSTNATVPRNSILNGTPNLSFP